MNPDYDDSAFALPPIEYHHHVVPADPNVAKEGGKLFVEPARGLNEQRKARRQSIDGRVKVAADIVKRPRVTPSGQPIGWEEPIGMLAARLSEAGFSGAHPADDGTWRPPERVKVTAWLDNPSGDMPEILKPLTRKLEPCLVWCDLNQEADEITDAIGEGAEQVAGTDEPDDKERKLFGFIDRKPAVLVTKPKIGGFGLNYQDASRMVFLGVSHSFEAFYQCIRREYRFGQKHKVDIDIVTSELEGEVVANLKRKEAEAAEMAGRWSRTSERPCDANSGQRRSASRRSTRRRCASARTGRCTLETARRSSERSIPRVSTMSSTLHHSPRCIRIQTRCGYGELQNA